MRLIKRKYLAASVTALILCSHMPAYSNDGDFVFQLRNRIVIQHVDLRGALEHNHLTLEDELKNASNWGLRSSRSATLQSSFLLTSGSYQKTSHLRSFLSGAINNSASLRSTLHEANAKHHASRSAIFSLLPTLRLTVEKGRESSINTSNNLSSMADISQASIAMDWTVYSSGARWGAIQSARWDAIAADLQFLATERQLFLENVAIYLELSTRKKLLREIRNTKNRLQKIRDSVNSQYFAGLTSRTDIAQVDAEIAAVQSEIEAAKYGFENQKVAYRKATGLEAPNNIAFPKVGHLIPASKEDAISRALNRNFTVQAAYATANSAAENSRAVRGQFLPRISLYSSATVKKNRNLQNSTNNGTRDWTAGVRLTVPLVDLPSMSSYQESRQQALAATYRSRDINHSLSRDIEVRWLEYHSLKKQRAALGKQEEAVKNALVGLRKELSAGLRPASDILREEIELTNVKVNKINIELRQAIIAYRMAAEFSDLSLSELAPI